MENNHQETVVIIPTFNAWHLLKPCLSSLRNQTYKCFKILVVNDGSNEETINKIKTFFPMVKTLNFKKNAGFSQTINKGIRYAIKKYSPYYLALLNNDTKAEKNWLQNLVDCIESEQAAAVASNMLFFKNPETINSQGGTINWNGDGYDVNFGKMRKEVEEERRLVLGICFGGALIRAEVFQKVGLPDERYYSYYEDLDWGWRANILGYKMYFEPEAILHHHGSASWENKTLKKVYLIKRNALTSALKNYELKNIPLRIFYIMIGYSLFFFDHLTLLINDLRQRKGKKTFKENVDYLFIPLRAITWNIFNLPKTLSLRNRIQKVRKISDKEIFKLVRQEDIPVPNQLYSLRNKFRSENFVNLFKKIEKRIKIKIKTVLKNL